MLTMKEDESALLVYLLISLQSTYSMYGYRGTEDNICHFCMIENSRFLDFFVIEEWSRI